MFRDLWRRRHAGGAWSILDPYPLIASPEIIMRWRPWKMEMSFSTFCFSPALSLSLSHLTKLRSSGGKVERILSNYSLSLPCLVGSRSTWKKISPNLSPMIQSLDLKLRWSGESWRAKWHSCDGAAAAVLKALLSSSLLFALPLPLLPSASCLSFMRHLWDTGRSHTECFRANLITNPHNQIKNSNWMASSLRYIDVRKVQGSIKRWALGCVILASWVPLAAGREFTHLLMEAVHNLRARRRVISW